MQHAQDNFLKLGTGHRHKGEYLSPPAWRLPSASEMDVFTASNGGSMRVESERSEARELDDVDDGATDAAVLMQPPTAWEEQEAVLHANGLPMWGTNLVSESTTPGSDQGGPRFKPIAHEPNGLSTQRREPG